MKELSIEEKARAYDEAKARISKAFNSNRCTIGFMNEIFPELKESEDERIRKALIEYFGEQCDMSDWNGVYGYQVIAWLEKQGKKPIIIDIDKIVLKYSQTMDGDFGLPVNCQIRAYRQGINDALNLSLGIKKQGEQKPDDKVEPKFNAGDIIRRKAPSSYDKDMQVARIEKDYYICNHIGKFSSEVVPFSKESCYELVEQKPSDNVKPKFHEGEWCIDNEDDTIFQIVKVLDNIYTYRTNKGKEYSCTHYSLENDARLWIVENANDGDVLAYKDEISIYKHDIKNCTKEDANFGGFVYHCCYDGKRFITDSLYSLTEKDKKDIYPATKEQRDTLFAKMKEAGYEWDVEKKELKKIENEIEIPFGAKDSELQEATYLYS